MSTTMKENQPLIVVVAGGGPIGLTFSINLTMMMGKHVKIRIYDGRWFVNTHGETHWQSKAQNVTRRDQVITIREDVIEEMPNHIRNGIFKKKDESVWPSSRNVSLTELEDRLFDLIQPFVQTGQIELVAEYLNERSECLKSGQFDLLVGADGSNSFIRHYCNIPLINEGVEYACSLAYKIPDKVALEDEPLHQAFNCVLSVSQTRYLVNSLTNRKGYLNVRLLQDEYDGLCERIQYYRTLKESLDLAKTNEFPPSPVWQIIQQGLRFFQIPSKYVDHIYPIKIYMHHALSVVHQLKYEIEREDRSIADFDEKEYKTTLVFLIGDAAINAHYWSGRGMNNGMKSAVALARNILRSCTRNDSIEIHTPLRYLDFLDYECFMTRLRLYEKQNYALRVLVSPDDPSVEAFYSYIQRDDCYKKYSTKLIEKLRQNRTRFQQHPNWPHKTKKITDDELQVAANRIIPDACLPLTLANPLPIRDTTEEEILVEQYFPYDLRTSLPVPTSGSNKIPQKASRTIPYRYIILWITGNKKNETLDDLIKEIEKTPNFTKRKVSDVVSELIKVPTIEEAKKWMKTNEKLIEKADIKFRIITSWRITDKETALDLIRIVRSISQEIPILIFPIKHEETQPAFEYPNILAIATEYELKEFVGIQQETQWNAGYQVLSYAPPDSPGPDKVRGNVPLPYPSDSSNMPSPSDFLGPPDSASSTKPRGQHSPTSHQQKPHSTQDPNESPAKNSPSSHKKSIISTEPVSAATSPPVLGAIITKKPLAKPILLWIDKKNADIRLSDNIQKKHPTLLINFLPTCVDVEQYVNQNATELQQREKIFVILRGYYSSDSKNYVEAAELFNRFDPDRTHICAYTKNRASLLEKTTNPPQHVDVYTKQSEIMDFIDRHLVETSTLEVNL